MGSLLWVSPSLDLGRSALSHGFYLLPKKPRAQERSRWRTTLLEESLMADIERELDIAEQLTDPDRWRQFVARLLLTSPDHYHLIRSENDEQPEGMEFNFGPITVRATVKL